MADIIEKSAEDITEVNDDDVVEMTVAEYKALVEAYGVVREENKKLLEQVQKLSETQTQLAEMVKKLQEEVESMADPTRLDINE